MRNVRYDTIIMEHDAEGNASESCPMEATENDQNG